MTALSKPRKTRPVSMHTLRRVLKDSKTAFEGGLACLDLNDDGVAVPGVTDTGLLPVGLFIDIPDNDGITGDDDDVEVKIRLFKEVIAFWFANDTGTAVTDADVGGSCWIKDDQTVSGDSTGRSAAGRVWAVDATKGVLVEPALNIGPTGATGPTGPAGP